MNLGVWTVEYTLPPKEGRNWAQNGSTTVVAATLPRAIFLVLEAHPNATIHAAHKRGQGHVIVDPDLQLNPTSQES